MSFDTTADSKGTTKSVICFIEECLWWSHRFWYMWIWQKQNLITSKITWIFFSNEKINELYIKVHSMAKNSFVAEVTMKHDGSLNMNLMTWFWFSMKICWKWFLEQSAEKSQPLSLKLQQFSENFFQKVFDLNWLWVRLPTWKKYPLAISLVSNDFVEVLGDSLELLLSGIIVGGEGRRGGGGVKI